MTPVHADAARREDTQSTVLIASEDVLATWSSSSATPTDLLALADADAQHALAVIERRRPQVVILEQMFAASARGSTLVNHLRSNIHLAGLDIRVLPAARSAGLGASGPMAGRVLASMAQPLQQGPTRRAPRVSMPKGAVTRLDGTRAALINVSTFGVQVISPTVLKPNQKLEVVLDRDGVKLRARAQVAWSTMELGPNVAYRAGVAFAHAQPDLIMFESMGASL